MSKKGKGKGENDNRVKSDLVNRHNVRVYVGDYGELIRACREDYVYIREMVKRLFFMPDTELYKLVDKANKPKSKLPVIEKLCIRLVVESLQGKKDSQKKFALVMSIITGSFFKEIKELPKNDLKEGETLAESYRKFVEPGGDYESLPPLSSDRLQQYYFTHPNLSSNNKQMLRFLTDLASKEEMSRSIHFKKVQMFMNKLGNDLSDVLIDHPRLYANLAIKMSESSDGFWEIPREIREIKTKIPYNKPGRPKGVRDSKPRKRKKKGDK